MRRSRSAARCAHPAILGLVVGLLGLVPGCCSHPCYDDPDSLPRTRELRTPFDAVDFVRFCVRHERWDDFYCALSRETRRNKPFEEELDEGAECEGASIAFEVVFPGLTYDEIPGTGPELAGIKVIDMIKDSAILRVARPSLPWTGLPADSQYYVALDYAPIDPFDTQFLLVNDGTEDEPKWRLGLWETGGWVAQLKRGP